MPAELRRGGDLAFRPPPINRSFERRIVVSGILVAAAFLVAALASTSLPAADRRGIWLPLHLALAGGASTAIAAVMPFFVAAKPAKACVANFIPQDLAGCNHVVDQT